VLKLFTLPAVQNTCALAEAAAQINDLVALAIAEKNYAAQNFLQWFVNEQVEEIASASTNLDVIKKAGSNVLMMEAWLAHINK
jgi:bacterioferritin B